jgi:hypothetical protein
LNPSPPKNLIPLSWNGLCQDDAEVEPVAADEERRRRRGQDAGVQRLPARGGDAGRDRGLEHLARLARVADHEHARRVGDRLGHAGGGGTRERQCELRGDELARDPADAVGAEQPARHSGAPAARFAAPPRHRGVPFAPHAH